VDRQEDPDEGRVGRDFQAFEKLVDLQTAAREIRGESAAKDVRGAGSSVKRISGRCMSARATATRWRSPPESSSARLLAECRHAPSAHR